MSTLRSLPDPHSIADATAPAWAVSSGVGVARDGEIIPVPLSSMVGRDDEAAIIRRVLTRSDVRLVTLTGPGGAGKTRLAMRVAREVHEAFAAGIAVVSLGSIHDPANVLPEIAETLGVSLSSDGREGTFARIRDAIGNRPALLVLDNMEQVVAAAPDVAALLIACPSISVLATSRERLRISGEHIVPVLPLGVPCRDAQHLVEIAASDAVRLFVDRAQAVAPGFALTEANATTVAEICRRLDGLPLAIELAAARADVLSPAALLARLERRLVLLTGGGRDQPERLRTMRSAIAWSYDLLTERERRLFRRLSVFADGCTLEAAELIGADTGPHQAPCNVPDDHADAVLDVDAVLDGIVSLVEKSLLSPRDGADGERRFHMLETIREFASERLREGGEADVIRWRHARWLLTVAEAGHAGLRSSDQAQWLQVLDAEEPNLRAALEWTISRSQALQAAQENGSLPPSDHSAADDQPTASDLAVLALSLCGSLGRFWEMRGRYREGRDWLRRVLELPGIEQAEPTKRGRAHLILGNMTGELGDLLEAERAYRTAGEVWSDAGESQGVADALNNLGLIAILRGDYEEAQRLLEKSLELHRQGGLPFTVALAISNLADLANIQGNYERAERLGRESMEIRERIGDQRGAAYSRHQIGEAALGRGDDLAAAAAFAQALPVFEAVGDRAGQAYVWRSLGAVAERSSAPDRVQRAARYYTDVVITRARAGKRLDTMQAVLDIVGLAVGAINLDQERGEQRLMEMATLLGAVDAKYQRASAVYVPDGQARRDATEAKLRAALGDRSFEEAYRRGADQPVATSVAQAVALAQWLREQASQPTPLERGNGVQSATIAAPSKPRALPRASSLTNLVSAAVTEQGDAQPSVPLTPREREVLTHVAAGKTDRDIAEELFISHRTVTTHVTSILSKLQVGSRSAAAAKAVRLGIA